MTAPWREVPLGECCQIVSGATPKTSDASMWGGDVCWITPKDLSGLRGKYVSDTPRRLTDKGLRSCSAAVLPPGAVLLSSRAPIGLLAINTVPMATNQGFKSFMPDPALLDANYLYRWLDSSRSFLQSLGRGATFKEISKAITAGIEIPLPPIEEQRRIAAVLDQADEVRAKRRASLALLDTITESIFLEMFGDPACSSGLQRRPLGDHLSFLTSGSRGWAQFYANAGALFLRIQNVKRDALDLADIAYVDAPDNAEARRTRVKAGDVLMSITADLGRTCVVPDNLGGAYINQHLSGCSEIAGEVDAWLTQRLGLPRPAPGPPRVTK